MLPPSPSFSTVTLLLLSSSSSSAATLPINSKQQLQFARNTFVERPRRGRGSHRSSYHSSRASLAFTSYEKSTHSIETTTTLQSEKTRHTSLLSSSKSISNSSSGSNNSKLPLLILTTVPIAFGSYASAIRLAGPLSDTHALVLQCMTYAIACCAIGMVRLVLYLLHHHHHHRQLNNTTTAITTASTNNTIIQVSKLEWKSGIQLGLLIAIAATLQSLGLQRTTAIRAGFLVRLSTIFVPLIDSAYIQHKLPSKLMIGALMLSLMGVLLLVLSPTTATATVVGTISIVGGTTSYYVGDILVALSAVFYSTHILLLGHLAPKCNPMSLATTKSATQLFLSTVILLLSLLFNNNIKNSLSSASVLSVSSSSIFGQQQILLSSIKNIIPPTLYHIALYTGIVTCAFPMYAQGYAQQYIKSSVAALIYATAPVWNAMFAAVILKERFTICGTVGAGFLIVGMISAIVASVRDE